MGTRSFIGYRNDDGSITGVYCHYDGYPSHQAPILSRYHGEDVRRLVQPGDMSTLDGPEYYTDRGESYEANAPRTFELFDELLEQGTYEYHYIYDFTLGDWLVKDREGRPLGHT